MGQENQTNQQPEVLSQQINQVAQSITTPVANSKANMSNIIIYFISILFFLHGIENIILFFYPIAARSSDILLTPPELIGGFFSFVCGYLIIRRSSPADSAVLLRCAGGIFSLGTITAIGLLTQNLFIGLLRIWPLIFFISMFVLIPFFNRKLPKSIESDKWILNIKIFKLLMIANWIFSFVYVLSMIMLNRPT